MAALGNAGIARIAESRDLAFADERYLDYLRQKLPGGASSELSRWRAQLQQDLGMLPMTAYAGQALYKIVLLCESRGVLERAYRPLRQAFDLVVQGCDERGPLLLSAGERVGRRVRVRNAEVDEPRPGLTGRVPVVRLSVNFLLDTVEN